MHGCIEPVCGSVFADEPYHENLLTAETLTEILQNKGVIPGTVCVHEVETNMFGVGDGLLSVMYRLKLDYGPDPDPSWPLSLVAKLTPPGLKPRVIGELLSVFEVEVNWYLNNMPESSGIPAPTVYHAAYGGYGRYVIIMEDLAPARPINQVVGASPGEAMDAVKVLARMHSRYRRRVLEAPETKDWVPAAGNAVSSKRLGDAYHSAFKALTDERYTVLGLEKAQVSALHDVLTYLDETYEKHVGPDKMYNHQPANKHAQFVTTLTHGDFRGENVFASSGQKGGGKVIDYQMVREGDGAQDLNYFVFFSLTIEMRRKQEMQLLRLYSDEMRGNGCHDMSAEELLLSYQRGLILGLIIFCMSANSCDLTCEGAKATIKMLGLRLEAMVTDWQFLKATKLRDSKRGIDGVTSKYSPDEVRESLPTFAHLMLGGCGDMDK